MYHILIATGALALSLSLMGSCTGLWEPGSERPGFKQDLRSEYLQIPSAYIPPQCYTRTQDRSGKVHNPCFTCHTESEAPNFINDADLQLEYSFAAPATQNPWTNLFVDRRQAVAETPDQDIDLYVSEDNYFASKNNIELAQVLAEVPSLWDQDKNNRWDGYTPDCYFNFDAEGFDRKPDNTLSGWRAFAYAPFPGTFWPTNGSAGDVLIRLPTPFRQDNHGAASQKIYQINLAIVEALITRRDVPFASTNEKTIGVDLDKNGKLTTATHITYLWEPLRGIDMSYVGLAGLQQRQGQQQLAAGLYPLGTEFLHSVRYLQVNQDQSIGMAPRMKELRYSRKTRWKSYAQLEMLAASEAREKNAFPDRLRALLGSYERGVDNGQGWIYQGFIEDAAGYLRPQSFQESVACLGCHSGIGATTDSSFAFARKLDSSHYGQGWFHWNQRGFTGIREPIRRDGEGEYLYYLQHNASGNEYRTNPEVMGQFFDKRGELRKEAADTLEKDISRLLLPSAPRARRLNKAYRLIVLEQGFIYGRDASMEVTETVHRQVSTGTPTGIQQAHSGI